MDHYSEDRPEIVFFDLETIYSTSVIVEFGAILVCPYTLTELRHYSTLVQPDNPSLIPPVFERRNGITRDALAGAPTFADIADTVYELLHDRVWAGHNIFSFDCPHIRKAFSKLNRPPPKDKAIIDSFPLLTETFGKRAGDMKMASLAKYFRLGEQTHRSLDDVRMNLEVIKYCASIMFLESSFPKVFRVNGKSLLDRGSSSSSDMNMKPISQVVASFPPPMIMSSSALALPEATHDDDDGDDDEMCTSKGSESYNTESSSSASDNRKTGLSCVVWKAHEIFISGLTASLVQSYHGGQRIQLFHNGFPFQISCADLKIRFGIRSRFYSSSGRPKFNFVVDASQSLCEVLGACDAIAFSLFLHPGAISEWKPLVSRKDDFFNSPTVRLHIAMSGCGDAAIFETDFKKETPTGIVQRLRFNKVDIKELCSLLMPGNLVDAIFSLDQYEYKQSAGLRLVAQKLIFRN